MRIPILILSTLALAACAVKPDETVYHEKEDVTRFTTQSFKADEQNKGLKLVAVKECPGKVICSDEEIKLTITHADRFSFFKGKDLSLETEQGKINLNERDYSNSYSMRAKAKDGTSGV